MSDLQNVLEYDEIEMKFLDEGEVAKYIQLHACASNKAQETSNNNAATAIGYGDQDITLIDDSEVGEISNYRKTM